MAAPTHIKSCMLLPKHDEKAAEELDPREELILKLVAYKKYRIPGSLKTGSCLVRCITSSLSHSCHPAGRRA